MTSIDVSEELRQVVPATFAGVSKYQRTREERYHSTVLTSSTPARDSSSPVGSQHQPLDD